MKSDQSQKRRDVYLARNWTKSRVSNCLEKEEQKFELIHFLRDRYHERFFSPIRCLREAIGNESGYGFAIMALCCLLIETIQCYREGFPSSSHSDLDYMENLPENSERNPYKLVKPWPKGQSEGMFNRFFINNEHFPDVNGEIFYKKVRCGLLHQAQTKGTWRLARRGGFWDESTRKINRDEFADRLEECFADYLSRLEKAEWKDEIWRMARRKIWWLAELS